MQEKLIRKYLLSSLSSKQTSLALASPKKKHLLVGLQFTTSESVNSCITFAYLLVRGCRCLVGRCCRKLSYALLCGCPLPRVGRPITSYRPSVRPSVLSVTYGFATQKWYFALFSDKEFTVSSLTTSHSSHYIVVTVSL